MDVMDESGIEVANEPTKSAVQLCFRRQLLFAEMEACMVMLQEQNHSSMPCVEPTSTTLTRIEKFIYFSQKSSPRNHR